MANAPLWTGMALSYTKRIFASSAYCAKRNEPCFNPRAAMHGTLEPRLRKAIDGATRVSRFIDYSSAQGWADGVDQALDAVEALASGQHAGIALKLAERAIERIGRAFESIDDSDGHIGALLNRAQEIHLTAAATVRPEPVQLAHQLFERETNDDFGVFTDLVAQYAGVLGEQGLAEYRRLAESAWQKLHRSGGSRDDDLDDDEPPDFPRLVGILDFFAERDGDVDARIALRSKRLSSPYGYLELAKFCLSQGRDAEALRRAEEGLWMFEDGRQDERLVLFAADLLVKADCKGDAEGHLWRTFEKQPSIELYAMLRKLGGEAARQRALKTLELAAEREPSQGWRGTASLMIAILIKEKMFGEAWAVLHKHGGSNDVREELARVTERTHPREALEVYQQRVEQLAASSIYEEAAKLVARMAKLQSKAEHATYLAALKERHKRRRNFMKLLG